MLGINEQTIAESAPSPTHRSHGESRRCTMDEALDFYRSSDLSVLAGEATAVRNRLHGNHAFFTINRHINYSNICILDCDFCAFGKRRRDPEAYELSLEEMAARARQAAESGAAELHIVGGLHPTWRFSRYTEMLETLREAAPKVTLKAFTAVEILHLSKIGRMSLEQTLEQLKEAGLGCLTGGGAEIFAPEIRRQICRGKETAEEWLMVHRTAHQLGIPSTATMLFGHLESVEDRIDHLARLRELQDETGGFLAFLPLPFHPTHRLAHLGGPNQEEILRTIAVSRIFLDNIPHIKAYWISCGLDLACRALEFGVDDLDGTIEEERIYHMAGCSTPVQQKADSLRGAIRKAGLNPVLRDSFYRPWTFS